MLSSDEFEGRKPGTPGEERTVQYLTGEFQKLGLKPGNTDGTYIQKVPLVGITGTAGQTAGRVGQVARDLQVARRCRGVDQARRRRRQHREFGPRLRRLRRRRARIQLGRLQGRRSQGQDDGRAGQRSAGAGSGGPVEARQPNVQRHRDDLLRPLDLQVRGGGAAGRGRRAHRPRDRAGRVSVRRRAGQPEREVRPGHAGQEHGPREHRGLAVARRGKAAPEDGRAGLRRAEEAGDHARVQAGAARAQGVAGGQELDADDRLTQRARQARGQRPAAQGRVRGLHRALGSLRHRRARRTATRSTTARSTTPRASPRCWRWRARSPR